MGLEDELGRLAQDDQLRASIKTTAEMIAELRQGLLASGVPPDETQVYVVTWLTGLLQMGRRDQAG